MWPHTRAERAAPRAIALGWAARDTGIGYCPAGTDAARAAWWARARQQGTLGVKAVDYYSIHGDVAMSPPRGALAASRPEMVFRLQKVVEAVEI